jgi:type VI secretion system secreted protein VgrG
MTTRRNLLSALSLVVLALLAPQAAQARNLPSWVSAERAGLETAQMARDFPRLGRSYALLAPSTRTYNCIAWSLGITDRWVWPGANVSDFDGLYGRQGYRRLGNLNYRTQPGVDKLVLYAKRKADGSWECTHAARQMANGTWTSKLGALPLIGHRTPGDVSGPSYGVPIAVYVRSARR